MSDLKPCPFCGGDAYTEIYIVEAAAGCRECQFKVTREHRPYEYDGLPKVIAAWNRRALPAVQSVTAHQAADRIEALTAQLESTLKDRKLILAERDRTFALMLARAEKAEAENARLREAGEKAICHITGYGEASTARIELRAALKGETP